VPFAALFVLIGIAFGYKRLRSHPLLSFFLASYLVAVILFVAWGIYWGGLPEFSQVRILK
jgi:multisubunit Na+/H+ antiporter MnhB subunit